MEESRNAVIKCFGVVESTSYHMTVAESFYVPQATGIRGAIISAETPVGPSPRM